MEKITYNKLTELKHGTIIVQLYHPKSLDGSRFDINRIEGDKIILVEMVGGFNLTSKACTSIKEVAERMKDNPKIKLYIADKWLQDLYRHQRPDVYLKEVFE